MKMNDVDIITISFFSTLLLYPALWLLVQLFNINTMIFPILMLFHNVIFWGSLIFVEKIK